MTKASIGLSNIFTKDSIVTYCNNGIIENAEEFKVDIGDSVEQINRQSVTLEDLERFQVGYSIQEQDSKISNVILQFNFKQFNSIPEKCAYAIGKDGFNKFKSDFENVMRLIIDGSDAVIKLNSLIKEIQKEYGASIVIEYRWSISDRICHIADWDYDKIKIKLNRSSVNSLIGLRDDNKLDDIVRENSWSDSIKDFIESFNAKDFHSKIGAVIEATNIEGALTENMLSIDDVVAVIRKNKGSSGTQNLKSIAIVKELGKFIVVSKWFVDYTKKRISMQIMDEKVLDADNGRFVSDPDLCNRIEQKVSIPDETIHRIFQTV